MAEDNLSAPERQWLERVNTWAGPNGVSLVKQLRQLVMEAHAVDTKAAADFGSSPTMQRMLAHVIHRPTYKQIAEHHRPVMTGLLPPNDLATPIGGLLVLFPLLVHLIEGPVRQGLASFWYFASVKDHDPEDLDQLLRRDLGETLARLLNLLEPTHELRRLAREMQTSARGYSVVDLRNAGAHGNYDITGAWDQPAVSFAGGGHQQVLQARQVLEVYDWMLTASLLLAAGLHLGLSRALGEEPVVE